MNHSYEEIAKKFLKINAMEDMFPAKKSYNLLDIIEYSSPSGDGYVFCVFKSQDNQYALMTYNGTTKQGFLPLLSNQQVDQNGYTYIVNGEHKDLGNDSFKLIGVDEQEKEMNVFLFANVDEKSEEYLWYDKKECISTMESQMDEFEGMNLEIIKKYLV